MAPIVLKPSLRAPIGLILGGAVLGWLGVSLLTILDWRDSWAALLLLAAASGFEYDGIRRLRARRLLTLEIGPQRFRYADRTTQHFQVTAIGRYADRQFRGVRVALGSDAAIDIHQAFHAPGNVLRAFKEQGYPVEQRE